jgi:hypothetical protein
VRFSYSGNSGVTIQNSKFVNSVADGLKLGAQMTARNNEFVDIYPHGHSELHTDAIQIYGGNHDVLVANFIHGHCEQGIGAFDGTSGNTITDNVVAGCTAHSMVLGGDKGPGSLVEHNTVVGSDTATLDCTSKAGEGPSTTALVDNIATGGEELRNGNGPCSPSQNTNNLLGSDVSGPNLLGLAQFVGGASPATYAGYRLAAGSPGKNAAHDGTDIGARIP